MVRLVITHEIPELRDNLEALKQRLNGNLTPLMRAIGGILENSTRKRFETKKDASGFTWKQLSPNTLKAKKGRGSILIDQSTLLRSITHQATVTTASVGTNRQYAQYLQTGTKNMPARAFIGLSDEDRGDIREIINLFLRGEDV